jgi:hypothetical protein
VVQKRNKSREDIVALFEQDGRGGGRKKITEKEEKKADLLRLCFRKQCNTK